MIYNIKVYRVNLPILAQLSRYSYNYLEELAELARRQQDLSRPDKEPSSARARDKEASDLEVQVIAANKKAATKKKNKGAKYKRIRNLNR